MSLSEIPPTPLSRIADRDLGILELLQLLDQGLERALDVGLEDQVEGLHLLLGHLAVEVLQRDGLALAEVRRLGSGVRSDIHDLAGPGDVVDDGELLAGGGDGVEAGDLHRASTGRPSGTERPLSSKRARTRPKPSPQTIDVADLERPVLDQDGGHHATTPRRSTTPGRSRSPTAWGWPSEVALQLGDEARCISRRSGIPLPVRGRGLHHRGVATVLDSGARSCCESSP